MAFLRIPAGKRRLLIITILIIAAAVICAGVLFGLSRRRADREAWYASLSQGRTLVWADGSPRSCLTAGTDEAPYLSLEDAQALFSDRWYADADTGTVRYALYDSLLVFSEGTAGYEENGAFLTRAVPPFIRLDGTGYLSLDILAAMEGFRWTKTADPACLMLRTDGSSSDRITLPSGTVLRTGPSAFSPVLTVLENDTPASLLPDPAGNAADSGRRFRQVLTDGGEYGYAKADASGAVPETVSAPAELAQAAKPLLRPASPLVLFHYVDDPERGLASLEARLPGLSRVNVLVPTCLTLSDTEGGLEDSSSAAYTEAAHEAGCDVWLMAENVNRSVPAAELFPSSAARDALRQALVESALRTGSDGINLDIEAVSSDVSYHYVQFVRELSADCERLGLVLSVCLPPPFRFNLHLNYPEMAAYADYLIIMAYDESWKDPGPGASPSFVQKTMDAAAELIPAEQTIAGLCLEARKWRAKDGGYERPVVSMKDCCALLAELPDAEWLEDGGCYHAVLPDPEGDWEIWMEDERSVRERLALLGGYSPAGYSVWLWGQETEGFWDLFR